MGTWGDSRARPGAASRPDRTPSEENATRPVAVSNSPLTSPPAAIITPSWTPSAASAAPCHPRRRSTARHRRTGRWRCRRGSRRSARAGFPLSYTRSSRSDPRRRATRRRDEHAGHPRGGRPAVAQGAVGAAALDGAIAGERGERAVVGEDHVGDRRVGLPQRPAQPQDRPGRSVSDSEEPAWRHRGTAHEERVGPEVGQQLAAGRAGDGSSVADRADDWTSSAQTR